MKIQTVVGTVDSNVELEKTTFSVNHSAHLFQVISTSLYTQPLKAIVREITCNAMDSHIKAGKPDLPVNVAMPSVWGDTFIIQDFGVGLTPKQIKEVYTVVFKSDKQNDNSLTGAFGLGSKSIFSYTQSFDIESNVDGKKYIYKAYLNETGIPELADLSAGGFDTDEPNGVKISFEVHQKDRESLKRFCYETYMYFDVKPNIINDEALKESLENTVFNKSYTFFTREGEVKIGTIDSQLTSALQQETCNGHLVLPSWAVYSNIYYNALQDSKREIMVVMGGVAYPLDRTLFPNFNNNNGVLIKTGGVIVVPMGSITPQASREHLQYDERTKSFLESVLEDIKSIETDELQKENEELLETINEFYKVKKNSNYPIKPNEPFAYKNFAHLEKDIIKVFNTASALAQPHQPSPPRKFDSIASIALQNINYYSPVIYKTFFGVKLPDIDKFYRSIYVCYNDDLERMNLLGVRNLPSWKSTVNSKSYHNISSYNGKMVVYLSKLDDKITISRLMNKKQENLESLYNNEIVIKRKDRKEIVDFLTFFYGKDKIIIEDLGDKKFDLDKPKSKKPRTNKPKAADNPKYKTYLADLSDLTWEYNRHKTYIKFKKDVEPVEISEEEIKKLKNPLLRVHIGPTFINYDKDSYNSYNYQCRLNDALKSVTTYNKDVSDDEKIKVIVTQKLSRNAEYSVHGTSVEEFYDWLNTVSAEDRKRYALKELVFKKNVMTILVNEEDENIKYLDKLENIWKSYFYTTGYDYLDRGAFRPSQGYLLPVEFKKVSPSILSYAQTFGTYHGNKNGPLPYNETVKIVGLEDIFKQIVNHLTGFSYKRDSAFDSEFFNLVLDKLIEDGIAIDEKYWEKEGRTFTKEDFEQVI